MQLYYRKMTLAKKASEGVLNIVGSFKGVVWRLFEDWPLDHFDKDDAFETMLKILDSNFSYDQRVQLPSDFEGYFNLLQRAPGQTLLTYVNDHEEAYRKFLQHKVSLPESVQGWHLLRRAALTKEQRQLVTLKAPTLEKAAIIEALYLLFGQDYKAGIMIATSASRGGAIAVGPMLHKMTGGKMKTQGGTMKPTTIKAMNRW